ncbi:beta-ketoacyl-[acyl-carrier-protein] synthase family protein [Rhodocyclus tenuis]|uniref:beta-ketoacyl-[acyl-carrier-protein] synthase family protein n=1 Tax=Rhodocyclus tenuis TaxID=1066 RepID=UPI001902E8B0|nr:beta-ketoacyl-[acyl-carrier-protein] synthase family protein [Rhodocyclus tenuis]MBK1680607.1 beta-ketoacyl synthase [Rhodocyclus tenuis]
MNKVLITGLGAISPLGADSRSTFAGALSGRSAICAAPAEIGKWLPQVLVAPAAAEPEPLLDRKYAGIDRATQFALVATREAMSAAGIAAAPEDSRRFGVFAGIGFGGAHSIDALYSRFYQTLLDPALAHKNPTIMHPLTVPRMMSNAAAALVSMGYGLHGPSNTYSVACASSAVAIGEAFRAIRHGYLDAAIVLGTEAMLTPGTMIAWNALRVMAKPDPLDPASSCRPFSRSRTGFVLGEGAAALVLESEARASRRQAKVVAELSAYGCSSDAEHLTAPSVAEQVNAMQQALDMAGLSPAQVQYLNAHGTATDAGDVVETQSIRQVFGDAADRLMVSSTKSMHGHLIGASGILEFMISLMALQSGSVPPTAYLDDPDPRCDLDFVPRVARHACPIDAVMSNSFAFGGSNVSLLARRYAA